ncbi:MAG: hypothetical protein EZS28_018882, partial [Streblomastix strix]
MGYLVLPGTASDKSRILHTLIADADHPALSIQPENNLQAEQPPAALQTPQMKYDAVLPFMKSLLNQTAHTPEAQHQIQQIASANLLIEQYYQEKVADMDPTGKRPTKYELEALDDRIQSTLGLEVNKKGAIERAGDADLEFEAEVYKLAVDRQRAAATAITSLATGDFESATQWMLTSHYYDRIIAGKAQWRREQALVPDIFKGLLGPNVGVSEVLGQKSKDKLNEQAKTAKLIEQPKESQTATPKLIHQPLSSIQQVPTLPQAQQYQQQIIQILPLSQPFKQLRQILQQSDYATILDIKDAFHNIHVQPILQQSLCFKFKNRSNTYLGLPFGWNLSPQFFSKTLTIVILAIRTKWKIKIQNYMDDIILIHHSKDTLKQTMHDVTHFLQSLGWRLLPNKCVLISKMTFQYLGLQFQTASIGVALTLNRRREMKNKLKTWIQMTIQRQTVTTRSLASLIGDINYLRFQFRQISFWTNSLKNLKTKAVAKGGWEASVKLNKQILKNLQTILILIKQNRPRKLKNRTPEHNPDDRCQRRWLGYDFGSFQRINIGLWPM